MVFSNVSDDVSISKVSPAVRDIGGLTELPTLTNLVPGSYTAVTEDVADDTIVKSITSPTLNVWLLDGLDIDASGLVRANYTNGDNVALGRLVIANFNNQNGLKQIGNATYVETSVSGTAIVGEAGACLLYTSDAADE